MILNNELIKYTVEYYEQTHSGEIKNEFLSAYENFELIENGDVMTQHQVSRIKNTARKIIDNFTTNDGEVNSKVGLMIGQVQSGKTKAFLATISAAFDWGYDAVIVLAGFDKTLMNQTTERLKETFESKHFSNLEIDIDEIEKENQIENIRKYLFDEEIFEDFKSKKIFSTLKNVSWLERMKKLLSGLGETNKKVLIIDDEGDQGSLNNEKKNSNNDDIDEATMINKSIRTIMNISDSFSFLTVTATPYANLIARKGTDLSPDFCISTEPGEKYKGLDYFHDGNYPMIKEIINFNPEKDMDPQEISNDIFNNAYPAFIIGNSYIRTIDKNKKKKSFEMLVHVKREINFNSDTLKSLEHRIEDDILKWADKNKNSIDYQDYYLKGFVDKGLEINGLSWVKDNKELYLEIAENAIHYMKYGCLFHLKSGEKYNPKIAKGDKVIIGAHLIERGVTFKNLRLTYMSFIAKNPQADSILQRARWFGYRDENEIQTVYLPKQLIDIYEQIASAQNDLYRKITRTKEGLLEVIENGFPFPIQPARATVNIKSTFGDFDSISHIQYETAFAYDNVVFEEEIINKMLNDKNLTLKQYLKWGHAFIEGEANYFFERYGDYFTLILNKATNANGEDYDSEIISKAKNQLEKQNINKLHLMLPSYFSKKEGIGIKTRKRKLYENINYENGLISLFQGRQTNEKDTNDFRPNDRDVLYKYCIKKRIAEPIVQIQSHKVEFKENGRTQFFYAIFMNNAVSVKGIRK